MQTQLPRRPYVELPPPPDGLASARRAGVRRRTRRTVAAFTGGVGAVAVVVVVILMLGGGRGVAMLRPAPAPPATQVPAPGTSHAPAVLAGHHGGPVSPGPGQQAVGSRPLTASSTAPSSSGSSSQHTSSRGAQVVLVRSQSRYTGYPRVCRNGPNANNESVQPGNDWCLDAATTHTDRGQRLSLELCRDSTSGGSLTFATTREVDFAVTSGGKTIWSWSHDHPGTSSQHTVSATADGCWVWSLVWPGITQTGAAVGHGSYTLVATTTAQELRMDGSAEVPFRY